MSKPLQTALPIGTAMTRPAVRIGIAIATLLAVHIALLLDRLTIAVSIILLGCLIGWATAIVRGFHWAVTAVLTISVLLFSAALVLLILGYASAAGILLAPPFLTFLGLAAVFGQTLLPGREALINRFIRHELGDVSPKIKKHGRRLTQVWTIMFVLMAIETIVVMFIADLRTWTWLINIINPVLIAVFFIGQHIHAKTYRPDGRPAPARATLKAMFTPAFWAEQGR